MQFQQDGPKDKKLQLFKFLQENLEKFRSTEHLSCASRGIDSFSLAQLHEPYSIEKLSISWAEICIFQQDRMYR